MISGKTVLFVVDSSYPNLSMNGIIAANIAEVLAKDNKILVISLRRNDDDAKESFGNKIIYIKSIHYYEGIIEKRRSKSSSKMKKWIYSCVLFLVKAISLFLRIISKYGLNDFLIQSFRKKIDNVLIRDNVDYVLCFSVPYESAVAVLELIDKHKSVRFIHYQADDFITAVDSNYPKFLLKRREKNRIAIAQKWEKELYEYRMLASAYENEKRYIDEAVVQPIGFPLIKEKVKFKKAELKREANVIQLTYTGSLVMDVRPPTDALDLLIRVHENIELSIGIYHRGNCGSEIDRYVERSNCNITNYGSVDIEQAYNAMENTDVLFAISTKAGDQISGKTFDYISTGKPVIFFYYKDADMNLKIYENYDLFIGIKMDNLHEEENVNRITDFLKEKGKMTISFSEVVKEYSNYTPEVIANELFSESCS